MPKEDNLTPKQEAFCNEYIIDFNASKSAIRAGYSPNRSGSTAHNLLKKTEIQKRICKLQEERSERTEVTQDRVLLEIARLAFNDPRKAFDLNGSLLPVQEWPDEVAAAISSIKITELQSDDEGRELLKEIKFWDKGRQIELAAKHLGMLTERLHHEGEINSKVTVYIPANARD